MLLDVTNAKTGEHFSALNDAVITRGGYARLIRVECTVSGEAFGTFTSDGMIAATPTGSTGYSLSAGGPIVEPSMRCIVLTPVCAHSLQQCPCVVSDGSEIRFRLQKERNQTAELQIDGMNRGTLEAGDEIIVTGSADTVRLIRLHPYHFYSLLHVKLREWGSNHE
jgi:NAD+ kinase